MFRGSILLADQPRTGSILQADSQISPERASTSLSMLFATNVPESVNAADMNERMLISAES